MKWVGFEGDDSGRKCDDLGVVLELDGDIRFGPSSAERVTTLICFLPIEVLNVGQNPLWNVTLKLGVE